MQSKTAEKTPNQFPFILEKVCEFSQFQIIFAGLTP
jgi:hypothetical protein